MESSELHKTVKLLSPYLPMLRLLAPYPLRRPSECTHGAAQCKSRGRQRNNSGLMSSLTKLPSMPCLLRLLRCSMPCPEALGPFHAMFRATHIMADRRLPACSSKRQRRPTPQRQCSAPWKSLLRKAGHRSLRASEKSLWHLSGI